MNETLETIRNTVQVFLPGAKVVLFGSRARGDNNRKSDYDLLIITPQTFGAQEKLKWTTCLDHAIVGAIHAPIDILLNSQEEVDQKKQLPGHIVRFAMKECVAL